MATKARSNRRKTSKKSPPSRRSSTRPLLDAVSDAVVFCDRDWTIVYMNEAAERATGHDFQRSRGKELHKVFQLLAEDTRIPVIEPTGEPVRKADVESLSGYGLLVERDGKETHVDNAASLVYHKSGKIRGLVIVCRDVTRHHIAGKRLLSEQKMAAIGTLARGIAHDFGNIIGVISGYASAMADSLLTNTRAHQDALKIIDAARHARKQIDRLLSVARASDPAEAGKYVPIAIGPVVSDARELLSDTLSERGILFEPIGSKGHSMHVSADPSQLMDVFMNLFLNAADAMPDGGSLSVSISSRHLEKPNVRLNSNARKGDYVVTRVRDTGKGMPPEVADHIFEPFFTTKEADAVGGLGLTVARSMVSSWGGWMTVRSTENEGTTFSVYLPRVTAGEGQQGTSDTLQVGTVLLMDDQKSDRDILTGILRDNGFAVLPATSASSALSLWRKHAKRIDVAILDLVMPGEEATDVFRELAADGSSTGIVMTSGFSRDYVRGCLSEGGWQFLQKPIEESTVLAVVRKAMDRHKLTRPTGKAK